MKRLGSQSLLAYGRNEYPEYHAYLATLFGGLKAQPKIVEEHDDGVGLVTALETGSGVAILPQSLEFTTGSRIKLIPIVRAPDPLVVGVAWVPSRITPAAERFLQVTRESAKAS